VLHVTNGDVVAGLIRDARLPGTIVPWQDALHEGPVPAKLSHEELRDMRARFIEACGWAPYEAVYGSFAERDRALAAVQGTEEVVLWFERDLYDQLQLIQILDRLGARRASLADLGEPRRASVVKALGLYERRVPVAGAARQLGRDAWRAFTSADPTDLERLLAAGTNDLPFLAAALLRHLQEFPSTRDGLSRTEQQLLDAVNLGAGTRAELFERTTAPEERPYLADVPFLLHLGRPRDGRVPLLEERDGAFQLTEAGRSVLAGEDDHVRLNGIDRWLGGVHLHGDEAAWRWDAVAGRLQPAGGG
jgi:hypothetical protein